MKTIGICSANVERSRMFQAVVGNEVREQNLDSRIEVYSAGINVKKILAGESPLRIQINILKGGLDYGIVRDEIKKEVEDVVSKGYDQEHTDRIKVLYGEIRPLVHGINFTLCNQALLESGIKEVLPPYSKFDVEWGYDLVLPMAAKDIEKVEKKFDDLSLEKPTIMAYGTLVGVEDLQDKNMASGIEGARKKVQYFMDTRKKAVEMMMDYAK